MFGVWTGYGFFEIINKHKSFWKKVQKNKMGLTKELLFGVVSTDSNIVSMVRKTSVLKICERIL